MNLKLWETTVLNLNKMFDNFFLVKRFSLTQFQRGRSLTIQLTSAKVGHEKTNILKFDQNKQKQAKNYIGQKNPLNPRLLTKKFRGYFRITKEIRNGFQ